MNNQAKQYIFIFIISILSALILLIYPVIAPTTGTINVTNPSYGAVSGNHTINEDTQYTFNITINHTGYGAANIASNLSGVNVTLPNVFTFTNGTNGTGNISATDGYAAAASVTFTNFSDQLLKWNGTTTNKNIVTTNATAGFVEGKNYTFIWFNASASTPGKYNITIRFIFNDSLGLATNTTNVSLIINDTTIPYQVNISNLTDKDGVQVSTTNANVSGKFTINVSSLDNGNFSLDNTQFTEISQINITVHNTTMASYNMSHVNATAPTAGYWNVTINSSMFSDGKYNITIYAKDQIGNVNGTINISNIVFDSTKPTATASCSNTYSGDAFPCSCSGSDATSGVKTTSDSSTSPDGTGTPSSTGSFTYTCTVTDYAGNIQSATASYAISSSGGGGSGGGGSDSSDTFEYKKTVDRSETELSEIGSVTESLKEKEKVQIKVNGEIHFVGIRKLTNTSATVEIASDPVQVNLDIGEEVTVNLDNDNFNDLKVTLNSISPSDKKADVTITYVHEEIPQLAPEETSEEVETTSETPQIKESTNDRMIWIWMIVGIVIVITIVYFLLRIKGNKSSKRYR